MATIKAHTDLPQSKKLAEFLPHESADMHYNNASIKGINYVDGLENRAFQRRHLESLLEKLKKLTE